MKTPRNRLTYANVVATIALFIALGGSAYAATQLKKNSIGTKQLKKAAVTEAKIGNEAVTTAKLKDGAVTGTKVVASSLGTVPRAEHSVSADRATSAGSADTLGGISSSGFVASNRLLSGSAVLTTSSIQPILAVPGGGPVVTTYGNGVNEFRIRAEIPPTEKDAWEFVGPADYFELLPGVSISVGGTGQTSVFGLNDKTTGKRALLECAWDTFTARVFCAGTVT